MAVLPVAFHADGFQNFDNAKNFFDARNAMKYRATGVQKGGAKQSDRGVFRGVDGDFAAEFATAANAKSLRNRVVN